MKITELLLDEMDREAVGIRETRERVPEGKIDWKARDVDAARRSGDDRCHHTVRLDTAEVMDELDSARSAKPRLP